MPIPWFEKMAHNFLMIFSSLSFKRTPGTFFTTSKNVRQLEQDYSPKWHIRLVKQTYIAVTTAVPRLFPPVWFNVMLYDEAIPCPTTYKCASPSISLKIMGTKLHIAIKDESNVHLHYYLWIYV